MIEFGRLSSLLRIFKTRPIGRPETSVTIYQSFFLCFADRASQYNLGN